MGSADRMRMRLSRLMDLRLIDAQVGKELMDDVISLRNKLERLEE